MAMAKTPRRSLRTYMRTAPVTIIPFRDTELLADIEAGATDHSNQLVYRLGKTVPAQPPRWERILHKAIDLGAKLFVVGVLLLAAASGFVMMMPKGPQ